MATTMTADPVAGLGFDSYSIDPGDERLFGPRGPIRLGNKAFQVLLKLVERRGRLVTKDELMASVWDGTIVSEFSLTSAIKELRRALDDDARTPRFIESVYGRGYRFLRPIAIVDSEPAVRADSDPAAWHPLPRDDARPAETRIRASADQLLSALPQRRAADASALRRSYRRLVGIVAALASLGPALTLAYASRTPAPSALSSAIDSPRCTRG